MAETRPDRRVTLIALFRRASQLMVNDLVERLAAAGYDDLPPAYHPVFENIDRDGTRLTTLAARAGLTRQSMGELVGTLETRGYLERRPDPFDRRARLVCLTDKGCQLVRVAVKEITAIEADWRRQLAIGDEQALDDTLRQAIEDAQSAYAPA
jgi:DNA-binding MarR family transcriptional regulator